VLMSGEVWRGGERYGVVRSGEGRRVMERRG
jgi:hypothetical protein